MPKKKKRDTAGKAQSEDKMGHNPTYSSARGDDTPGVHKVKRKGKKVQGGKFKVSKSPDPYKIENPKEAGKARHEMSTAHWGPKAHGDWKGAKARYEKAVSTPSGKKDFRGGTSSKRRFGNKK